MYCVRARLSLACCAFATVDGNHFGDGPLRDVRGAMKLVRPGGYITGDDALFPAVAKALDAFDLNCHNQSHNRTTKGALSVPRPVAMRMKLLYRRWQFVFQKLH